MCKDGGQCPNNNDVLIRTYILDVEQQYEVEGCISKSFNVVEILEATKVLLIVDVPRKGLVFKMRLIIELNTHPSLKLPLDKLRRMQYRTCVKGSFTQEVHEVEKVVFLMMLVSSWNKVRS